MNTEQLSGIIEKILFSNQETGFSVFIIHSKKIEPTTVTGTFINIQAGQEIHLQGSWAFHPKFGKQFQAYTYSTDMPTSSRGIEKYLSSGFIKGIGKVYAKNIVEYFGQETLKIIDNDPDQLCNVPGIGTKRLELIKKSWIDQKFIAKIMVFLQEKGVSATFATKIYKKYGQNSIAKLSQDPYQLTDDVWGIGFKTADKIAQNMGFATGSVQRIQAGILFTLKQESNHGHVFQEIATLKEKTCQLLEIDPALHQSIIKNALTALYQADKIKLISWQEQHFITISSFYSCEKGIAQKILRLQSIDTKHVIAPEILNTMLQATMHITLNEKQQAGIVNCFVNKVSIITGGPGTGKTTLVKTLIAMLESQKLSYKLTAPTGRAAKRLMENCQRPATTIHRLLEFDPATMKFVHNEHNVLNTDFLIIDETSMIDIFLMHNLLKAVNDQTHILFLGDIYQLPSIGPGNVLKDFIASQKIACTMLSDIFRQAQDSMIIHNAHLINKGSLPNTHIDGCKKDFYFIAQNEVETLFDTIKKLFHTTIAHHNFKPEQVTILTPMNRGAAGTQKLNQDLQQLLNPSKGQEEATFMGTPYRVNDRVMQIRNNYDKKTFNGDIGIILAIDQSTEELTIDFDGTHAIYSFDELNELVLAYAITIHKSQGSEYNAVIIPIFMQHFMLLQRNLIYTGITRAKKLCIFIGQTKALAMGIKNEKQNKRITFLQQFLTTDLSCR